MNTGFTTHVPHVPGTEALPVEVRRALGNLARVWPEATDLRARLLVDHPTHAGQYLVEAFGSTEQGKLDGRFVRLAAAD